MKGGCLEDILIEGNIYGAQQSLKFWRKSPTNEELEQIRSHTKLSGD